MISYLIYCSFEFRIDKCQIGDDPNDIWIKQKFNPTHQLALFKRMLAFRGRVLLSRLQTLCRGGNHPFLLSNCNLPNTLSIFGNGMNRRFLGTVPDTLDTPETPDTPDASKNKNETLKKHVLEKR